MTKNYYWTQGRNGTEDEITIYTPDDRPMLCVAFWDKRDCDDGQENAPELKADAQLIVDALNAYQRNTTTKPTQTGGHTPGPWEVIDHGYDHKNIRLVGVSSSHGWICDIAEADDVPAFRLADAHLIAAAPELLQCLETLLKMVEDGDYTTIELNSARAAIAKATGRAA